MFCISIHAPARGASRLQTNLSSIFTYFNSRPCERGFLFLDIQNSIMRISIHAPARGASQKTLYFSISLLFQFTPLREGLQRVFECAGSSSDFNSRPCERGFAYASISFISPTNFNSRPCERGFVSPSKTLTIWSIFQFTPLREGLPSPVSAVWVTWIFQFTPLREGLQIYKIRNTREYKFQFTPLREGLP